MPENSYWFPRQWMIAKIPGLEKRPKQNKTKPIYSWSTTPPFILFTLNIPVMFLW